MSVPVICPRCYRSIPAAAPGPDGLLRCDVCHHAFPPSVGSTFGGATDANYARATTTFDFPAAGAMPPAKPAVASPAYPSAAGPSNPGLVTCGIIAGIGMLTMFCCAGVGLFALLGVRSEPAPNVQPMGFPNGFPQPNARPPGFNPRPFEPPPPIQFPPTVFPEPPPPTTIPFAIPGTPPADAIPPDAVPPSLPNVTVPIQEVPVTPPPVPTLNEVLEKLKTIDPNNFASRQLLEEFAQLPVEESRRDDAIAAVLQFLERARFGGVNAAEPVLEKWASRPQSLALAKFAANNKDISMRRVVLELVGKVGGDVEVARVVAPLLRDPGSTFIVKGTLQALGPVAEEPTLELLDDGDLRVKHFAYDILEKIGGEKSRARIADLSKIGQGFDRVMGRRALTAIEERLKAADSPASLE